MEDRREEIEAMEQYHEIDELRGRVDALLTLATDMVTHGFQVNSTIEDGGSRLVKFKCRDGTVWSRNETMRAIVAMAAGIDIEDARRL